MKVKSGMFARNTLVKDTGSITIEIGENIYRLDDRGDGSLDITLTNPMRPIGAGGFGIFPKMGNVVTLANVGD